MNTLMPDCLTHYYNVARGPFRSLTALDPTDAARIQAAINESGQEFASQRSADYLDIRRELEARIRALFIDRGGQPQRPTPHYMLLGMCDWIKTWYTAGQVISIPLEQFDLLTVSFTYGDSFPAMRYGDGKPWRGQVYTAADLPRIIQDYGLPQTTNPDGERGPDRYIEAQVWSDEPLHTLGWLQK